MYWPLKFRGCGTLGGVTLLGVGMVLLEEMYHWGGEL